MAGGWCEEEMATSVLRAALALRTASFRELLVMRAAHNCSLRWCTRERDAPAIVERSGEWDRLRIAAGRAVVWGRTRSVLRLLSGFAWLARERDAHTATADPEDALSLVRIGDGVWEATRHGRGAVVCVRARLDPDGGWELGGVAYGDALAVLPVLYAECPRVHGADPQPQTALALGQ